MANTFSKLLLATGVWIAVAAGSAAVAAPAQETPVDVAPTQEAISADRVAALIGQLGDKSFFVREQAQADLARFGFEAFDALNAATTHEDLEIAARAKYLLRLMRVEWTAKNDPPEVKRCLRDYESQDPDGRRMKMRELAELRDDLGLLALCRLVRFEKAVSLSKLAAVELLRSRMGSEPPNPAVAEAVRKAMNGSKQPAAAWLLAWTRLASDSEGTLTEWNRLIDAEQAALQHASGESRPEIISELIRFQVAQLKRLGKSEEAMRAIDRLVTLERGDSESLSQLAKWLVDQQAWKAVGDLSQRFAVQFAKEPRLLYLLAQAYAEQKQEARANETAAIAFGLFPGKQPDQLQRHLDSADRLRRRGLFAWARREFEHVIAKSDPNDAGALTARIVFAEMLHDQGEELDAAKVVENLVKTLGIHKGKGEDVEELSLVRKELRPRMHLFYACHWEKENDLAKRRESLDKALECCDTDVDVLIGCYRLPEQPAEYHTKIVDLIHKSAANLRQQIADDPEDPDAYNQLAWLIGNTQGDFDEALKLSQKSVELKPTAGGYYDTLARVYYAKKDYESAVKFQTQALELEPYSGQMLRQMDLFRKALEEKKK